MNFSSVRVRVGLWHALFTFSCLALFGVFLLLYLTHALEASRAPTIKHRAARLVAFVNGEYALNHDKELDEILDVFLKVSPETDEVIVRASGGTRLVFVGGGESELAQQPSCAAPCFREFAIGKHHFRSYTENVVLTGSPVTLTVAGSVDEHYQIIDTVLTSLLLFVPILLFVSLFGGYLLSSRSLGPVGRMTANASRLSMSDLNGRIVVPKSGDELEALARAWNDMLDRLQSSVERSTHFISDASHDLRTSLAVMLGSAQLALKKPRDPEEYRRTLGMLLLECEHTVALLEELLATSRFGLEQYELRCEVFDLSCAVRERCALFHAEAERKSQHLQLQIDPECVIDGDRLLLLRLVGILVENAIKYTPEGGQITVSLESQHDGVTMRVKDSGRGILPGDLSLIFSRKYRAKGVGELGSGLGLSIASWIAEAHAASLRAYSQIGQGSTFELIFPRAPASHIG